QRILHTPTWTALCVDETTFSGYKLAPSPRELELRSRLQRLSPLLVDKHHHHWPSPI
ncbi:hypothetical protein PQX77_021889, partial [Marasmius sp. AFHP31]